MHFGVLAAADSWYFADLQRAAGGRCQLTSLSYRSLQSSVTGGQLSVSSYKVDLAQLNGLLVRSMPPGSLEQVVFRMDALAQLEVAGVTVINPAKAIEAAVDKY